MEYGFWSIALKLILEARKKVVGKQKVMGKRRKN